MSSILGQDVADSRSALDADQASSRERILRAARAAIEQSGVLGLRVGQVASEANTSLTLIYKYFESRDGLLAHVLGDMFEEFIAEDIDRAERFLQQLGTRPLTSREVVELIPMPGEPGRERQRWLRIQILAASREIPALRVRLEAAQSRVDARIRDLLGEVERRLGRSSDVPAAALALLVQAMPLGYVLDDLLTADRVAAAELRELYIQLFSR